MPKHEIHLRAETDPGLPRSGLRYALGRSEAAALDEEARRALAVYRAVDLMNDASAARALLAFSGAEPRDPQSGLTISKRECESLARALRSSGYPLDDGGIGRFKMERGYSRIVRIGPDVAAAYARHARGMEARLQISREEWQRLDAPARRALKMLLLIGRRPERLLELRRLLDVARDEPAARGVIPVGGASGRRLLAWAEGLGFSFDDAGLKKLGRAAGFAVTRIDEPLADFVADLVSAPDEPQHDYTRLSNSTSGTRQVLNRRTFEMLGRAERLAGAGPLRIIRGSYEAKEARGAHPHQGGGIADLCLESQSPEQIARAVRALRETGFAAWYRSRQSLPHIHAVAIGDRELAPAAEWQVKAYFRGKDGRTRSSPDPHAGLPAELPRWAAKYRIRCL